MKKYKVIIFLNNRGNRAHQATRVRKGIPGRWKHTQEKMCRLTGLKSGRRQDEEEKKEKEGVLREKS